MPEYVAELVRTLMFDIFQQETYTRGLNVYTTINSEDQGYAYKALRSHLQSYDHSQGYRGPEAKVDISDPQDTRTKHFQRASGSFDCHRYAGGCRLRSLADGS